MTGECGVADSGKWDGNREIIPYSYARRQGLVREHLV